MSQLRKLLDRLASSPRDFTWDEMCALLGKLGFQQSGGAGSRVCFYDPRDPSKVIHLHKPHGRNPPTVLVCYVNDVAKRLREWGYYND